VDGIDGPCSRCGLVYDGADESFEVDVPTARVTVRASVGGEPVTGDNTTDRDWGRIRLVDPDTGADVFGFGRTGVNEEWAALVVAGRYEVWYESGAYRNAADAPGAWPVNDRHLLGCVELE